MANQTSQLRFKIPIDKFKVKQKFAALTPEQYLDFILTGIMLLKENSKFSELQKLSVVNKKFKF